MSDESFVGVVERDHTHPSSRVKTEREGGGTSTGNRGSRDGREKKTTDRALNTGEDGRKGPTITSSGSRPSGRMPPSSFVVLNALEERLAEGDNKTSR